MRVELFMADDNANGGFESEMADIKRENATLKMEIKILRETAELYRNIFEAAPASIYVIDRNGYIIEINPHHIKTFGQGKTTRDDYVNQHVFARQTLIQAGLIDKIKGLLSGKEFDEKEVYMPITSGGKDAFVNLKGLPMYQNGEIVGAIVISEDVTQLKKDREELIRYREHLEQLIEERTRALQLENIERKKAEIEKEAVIVELQKALDDVKKLSGMLPICASCKKIRDDEGYWHQVEVFIRDNSEVEFSHGICPECFIKLYPEYLK